MFHKKRVKEFIERNFGKNPLDSYYYDASKRIDKVKKYHITRKEIMNPEELIDDITWDDLEMDQMYLRVNNTQSFAGEQVLYHELHQMNRTVDEKDTTNFESKQNFYKKNKKQRLEIQSRLYEIGKREEAYSLPEFINNLNLWKMEHPILIHIMQVLLVFFIATAVTTETPFSLIGLISMVLLNTMIYHRMKQKYDIYLYSLGNIKQLFAFAKWMVNSEEVQNCVPKKVKKSVVSLNKLSRLVFSFTDRKQGAVSGDISYLFQEYLYGVSLIDLSLFNYIIKIIWDKQQDIWNLYEFVGETDANLAVLSYRESVENWCQPEYINGTIEVKELVHPLIEQAVSNDFIMKNKVIITGANASGKSTFMKAVAINAILAQSIHTCIASEFNLTPGYVMTCMALRDDVISGESYYFREAKYLKRMIEIIDQNVPVLCVIDEILKGTNTVERIAASKAILNHISRGNCFIMVATHDRELTESKAYQKFHFTSVIEGNDVKFDYKIREGVCKDTNAIALLNVLGYSKDIVNMAKDYIQIA